MRLGYISRARLPPDNRVIIRWPTVRPAEPESAQDRHLQCGLSIAAPKIGHTSEVRHQVMGDKA